MKRPLPATGSVEIAPSILAADFSRLGEHVRLVEPHVRILHIDIMDGHFVPNLSMGPPVVAKIRPHSDLFFDVHLMISDPVKYAEPFVKAGADGITFHLEAVADPAAVVEQLRGLGVAVGISIKPGTAVSGLAGCVGLVDMVLLMTVEPGFGGQSFIPESLERAAELKKLLRPDQRLEVDGGIDPETTGAIVRAGADTLVAGSAIFAQADPVAALRQIQAAAG